MRVTPRRLLGGLGLFGGGAVLCAFFGIAMLIAALLGPEAVLWTGTAVHGTEADGKVTYTFRGTTYQLDEPNSHATRNVILFRRAPANVLFQWESGLEQPAGRWHGEGEGPAQYLADTPDGAWAEFLRHEHITDPADLAGERVSHAVPGGVYRVAGDLAGDLGQGRTEAARAGEAQSD